MPRKTYLLCNYLSSLSTHNDPELTLGRCRVFLFFTFPILSHPPCFVMHLTMEGYILGPGLGLRALWLLPRPSSPNLQLKTLRELTGQMQKSRTGDSVSKKPSLGPSGFSSSCASFFEPEVTVGIHLPHKVENKDLIKGTTLGDAVAESK